MSKQQAAHLAVTVIILAWMGHAALEGRTGDLVTIGAASLLGELSALLATNKLTFNFTFKEVRTDGSG